MNFDFSPKTVELQQRLSQFMNDYIYPAEDRYAQEMQASENRWQPLPLVDSLLGVFTHVVKALNVVAQLNGLRFLNVSSPFQRLDDRFGELQRFSVVPDQFGERVDVTGAMLDLDDIYALFVSVTVFVEAKSNRVSRFERFHDR